MMPGRMLPLHCLLAAVLILGGLPALGEAATTAGPDPEIAKTDEQTDSHANCHGDQTADEASGSQTSAQSCCDLAQGCSHGGCDCGCLALSLVIPIREAPEAAIRRPAPPSSLTTVFERHATSPPIRPPKA